MELQEWREFKEQTLIQLARNEEQIRQILEKLDDIDAKLSRHFENGLPSKLAKVETKLKITWAIIWVFLTVSIFAIFREALIRLIFK